MRSIHQLASIVCVVGAQPDTDHCLLFSFTRHLILSFLLCLIYFIFEAVSEKGLVARVNTAGLLNLLGCQRIPLHICAPTDGSPTKGNIPLSTTASIPVSTSRKWRPSGRPA